MWIELRKNVMKYGTRNSLLTALMPTASTSQILSNNANRHIGGLLYHTFSVPVRVK